MDARRTLVTAAALLAGAAARAAGPDMSDTAVYGRDDRQDLYAVADARVRGLAGSTVALFRAAGVESSGGQATLRTVNYGQARNLCPDERFREQSSGAFCSGALVAPDLVLTAGHCVRDAEGCRTARFVFGFALREERGDPTRVPSGEVYSCASIVSSQRNTQGADFALVRLDRAVSGHAPLAVSRSGAPQRGTPLFVIGHPSGLPAKVAGGARVREVRSEFLVANLDTYGGNSGSPVFNAETREVAGILVRGDRDFVRDEARGCMRSNVLPDDGGRGEDVTLVSAVQGLGAPAPGAHKLLAGQALESLARLAAR